MLWLKWLLTIAGVILMGSAGALVAYDIYVAMQLRRLMDRAAALGRTKRRPLDSQPHRRIRVQLQRAA